MRDGYPLADAHMHIYGSMAGKNAEGMPAAFPIGEAIRLMDANGVDKALLMQNPTIGIINEEIAEAVRRMPGRFAGAVQVDPLSPDAVETFRRYAALPGMRALKLEMSEGWGWLGIHPGLRLDADAIIALLDAAPPGFTVVIDTGPIGMKGYQADAIRRHAWRYPAINFLVEHLGYLTAGDLGNKEKLAEWRKLIGLGKAPNVYFGLSASPLLLKDTPPFPRVTEALKRAQDTVGADKLLWGSDAPGTLAAHSYREMADCILEFATFLMEEEKALIVGGNALRLFFKEKGEIV
jgi:predicted TIM-barrel fold metal-dependent hydrolase